MDQNTNFDDRFQQKKGISSNNISYILLRLTNYDRHKRFHFDRVIINPDIIYMSIYRFRIHRNAINEKR